MEVERPKLRDEPHLSSAYIRSLVKQLSSSKSKAPTNPKSPNRVIGDELLQDLAKQTQCISEVQQQRSPPPPPQPQLPKKQVRRRLHTSRPYQKRILNMAEARREIVAALKFHRAAMKQANEEQQQHHQQQKQNLIPSSALYPSLPTLEEPHQELIDSKRNDRLYPPNYIYPYYHQDPSFSSFLHPSVRAYPSIPPLSIADNLNLPLPNQPLGLNLNIQGFNDLDISISNNNTNNLPIQPLPSPPASSCSSYSYSSPPTMSGLEIPSILDVSPYTSDVVSNPISTILHPVMDDEDMAKIHSIGEQYDMEWNDTMNLFTSIWWSKFLKNMEGSPNKRITRVREDGLHVFDEILAPLPWLSDGYSGDVKDSYLLHQQQQMDDYNPPEDYLKDVALSCLDIGEIESWDAEWLS